MIMGLVKVRFLKRMVQFYVWKEVLAMVSGKKPEKEKYILWNKVISTIVVLFYFFYYGLM